MVIFESVDQILWCNRYRSKNVQVKFFLPRLILNFLCLLVLIFFNIKARRQRKYRKFPKINPGAYIFQRPFLRGLSTEGILRFKINWARLIVGSKFTVLALFYFVFEGNFQVQAPRGAYIWRGNLTEGFCVTSLGGLYFEGLIHGGAYFRNFTVGHLHNSVLLLLRPEYFLFFLSYLNLEIPVRFR